MILWALLFFITPGWFQSGLNTMLGPFGPYIDQNVPQVRQGVTAYLILLSIVVCVTLVQAIFSTGWCGERCAQAADDAFDEGAQDHATTGECCCSFWARCFYTTNACVQYLIMVLFTIVLVLQVVLGAVSGAGIFAYGVFFALCEVGTSTVLKFCSVLYTTAGIGSVLDADVGSTMKDAYTFLCQCGNNTNTSAAGVNSDGDCVYPGGWQQGEQVKGFCGQGFAGTYGAVNMMIALLLMTLALVGLFGQTVRNRVRMSTLMLAEEMMDEEQEANKENSSSSSDEAYANPLQGQTQGQEKKGFEISV